MGWDLFRREGDGAFELIGVDGDALDDGADSLRPVACEVTIDAESAAPNDLDATERALESIVRELDGRLVATRRSGTQFWVLVYLASDEHAGQFTRVPLPARASISVAPSIDPAWTLFDEVRPVGFEEQSMLDLRVMHQLHAAGDAGGVRPIDHVIVGLNERSVDEFFVAVSQVFDSVRLDAGEAGVASCVVTVPGDPADITSDTWTIRQIAERHGGAYDGWGCAVVAAERAPRRRWWRRD